MKFNIEYLIVIIISFVLFPNTLKAEENLDIKCQKNNEYTECQISGKSNYEVSAIEYRFSLSNDIEKIEFTVDESWQGDEEDNLVLLYTDNNKKGDLKIGTIYLKSDNNISSKDIITESLIYYDADFQSHVINSVNNEANKDNKEKNSNNILMYCVIIIIGILVLIFVVRTVKKGALLL